MIKYGFLYFNNIFFIYVLYHSHFYTHNFMKIYSIYIYVFISLLEYISIIMKMHSNSMCNEPFTPKLYDDIRSWWVS